MSFKNNMERTHPKVWQPWPKLCNT